MAEPPTQLEEAYPAVRELLFRGVGAGIPALTQEVKRDDGD
jgi:hypothetical protein